MIDSFLKVLHDLCNMFGPDGKELPDSTNGQPKRPDYNGKDIRRLVEGGVLGGTVTHEADAATQARINLANQLNAMEMIGGHLDVWAKQLEDKAVRVLSGGNDSAPNDKRDPLQRAHDFMDSARAFRLTQNQIFRQWKSLKEESGESPVNAN